jgi:sugar phosphate isomerase/epimerase
MKCQEYGSEMEMSVHLKKKFLFCMLLSGTLLSMFISCRTMFIPSEQRCRVSVCDWMILNRQKPGAVALAHKIGADGLEVDMGGLGNRPTFDNKFTDPIFRKEYDSLLRHYNMEISSIAMSGFYAQSFADREGVVRMVQDCINTMTMLGVKVAFLPLGVQGDLVRYPEKRIPIVERLRLAGKMAERAGVIIGIETSLEAREEKHLLKEIGSPAIKIYFNFANALESGRDLCREIRILGRSRICQIHCTDKDGLLLSENKRIDIRKVRSTLDKIGWKGWLVIERSRSADFPTDVVRNFSANTAYLKSIFQSDN